MEVRAMLLWWMVDLIWGVGLRLEVRAFEVGSLGDVLSDNLSPASGCFSSVDWRASAGGRLMGEREEFCEELRGEV